MSEIVKSRITRREKSQPSPWLQKSTITIIPTVFTPCRSAKTELEANINFKSSKLSVLKLPDYIVYENVDCILMKRENIPNRMSRLLPIGKLSD